MNYETLEKELARQLAKVQSPERPAAAAPTPVKKTVKLREGTEVTLRVYTNNPHDAVEKAYVTFETFQLPAEMDARKQAKAEGLKVLDLQATRRGKFPVV